MKYAIILPDGAADDPLPQLGNRTPLQAAHTPNMDWVCNRGRLGRLVTVPSGFTPATDVATLSLFGYDPHVFFSGRAPLEALAQRLEVGPDQLVFRCNFVNITDGVMVDFTAHHIAQDEAVALIGALNAELGSAGCSFHAGVSYRNLMLASRGSEMKLRCTPPHDIQDRPVAGYLPAGEGNERVRELMHRAKAILARHEVNRARFAAGKPPVTDIWLWGQGRPTTLEPFEKRWGLKGAVITAVDILRGIAVGMDMRLIDVPGATGFIDTNYAGKGAAAVRALDDVDVIVVHIEAPDEAAHLGDAVEKVRAIERVDEHVVGPLLEALRSRGDWRMLIAPDHPTTVATKGHSATPPPFCYAGARVEATSGGRPFHEAAAAELGPPLDPGHAMIEEFLGIPRR